MPTGTQTPSTVVVFGDLRVPRALAGLPAIRVAGPLAGTVEATPPGGRLAVVGGDADLAAHATHVHLHNALTSILDSLEAPE
jgi:hypothetical protein